MPKRRVLHYVSPFNFKASLKGGVHFVSRRIANFVSRRKAHEVHFVSRVLLVKKNVWPKYLIINLRITIVEIRKGGDKHKNWTN